ncbi:Putative F-box domain-containing protein [Septoria linicola]|uniref:F-box domain-containing protein n=1 Tax=Septoria linicola TaxID=215465 RepID=A0A9Q9EKM7_9PEZI|nr:putative F-box domain-containing protein [Septoria linicola]USW52548.1 Putative F-box domain-containing protein [Septoria linicola]
MSSILDLPAELLLRITEHLPFHSIKTASLTNSQLHKFLQPLLFKCLRATNQEEDEADIRCVIEKYGREAEMLAFELHLSPGEGDDDSLYNVGNESEDSDRESGPQHRLTTLARDLLSGQLLRDISEVRLKFMPADDFEGEDWGDDHDLGGIHIHEDHETQDDVSEREQSLLWRRIINETYQALASRKGVKKLELSKVVPRACSTFYSAEWQGFLGNVEDLHFSLWGSSEDSHSNAVPGYLDFCEDLNDLFFTHLQRLTKLTLIADPGNPMGMNGGNHHLPTPIRPSDMPKLMCLELENFFVEPALVNFVRSHSKTLASLSLKNCLATSTYSDSGRYSWTSFFGALRECHPMLDTFTVTNERVPLTQDEQFHQGNTPFVPSDDEPENVKLIRKQVLENPNLRLWPYVYLDDKYGIVYYCEEDNIEAFEAGEDQAEYDAWMRLVASNQNQP